MPSVLVDTGVWYSFYDARDMPRPRKDIDALAEMLGPMKILIPWPVMYETVRTRFARNYVGMSAFERQLKSTQIEFIEDTLYRNRALEHCFESTVRLRRPLSLVDSLVRVIIADKNIQVNFLATYNDVDFHDVCALRGIELLPF